MPRKFTYWIAPRNDDSPCYSLIGRTKKEVTDQFDALHVSVQGCYAPAEKREIPYEDMFDFFARVTEEDGGRDCGYQPGTNSRYRS